MALPDLTDDLLTLLRRVDTPTVCNAIEVVQGKRGFAGFTRGTMVASHPGAPAMVGFAATAKLAGVAPPAEPADVIRTRRMAYYRMVSEAPRPTVAVIEDVDFPTCVAAYWGEINTTVHQGLGVAGALTNGVVRDLGDLPDGFPVVAGSIGPSHGFAHLREIATPVSVFGLTVAPADLVHADRHGAVVIPPDVLSGLAEGIHRLLATEHLILEPARRDGFDFAAFEAAWTAFENART
jgi:regulator of RNase E activity RraA